MGLDCSHNAWNGAYSAFNRFRQEIARHCGVDFPPHWEFNDDGTVKEKNGRVVYKEGKENEFIYWPDEEGWAEKHPGLVEFFMHSDCDGEISPEMCVLVADELEEILPKLNGSGGGHISARGGYAKCLREFIDGCRAAAAAGEPLEFY